MTHQTPAVLIHYGQTGAGMAARVQALAPVDALLAECEHSSPDLAAKVATLAERVPGNTTIRVIHLLGEETTASDAVIAASARSIDEVTSGFPALGAAHWIIDCVGQEASDDELRLPAAVLAGHLRSVRGLLLVSRSSEAQALLDGADEVQMGGDLAHLLITSELGRAIEELRVVGAGVTSVIYRRRIVVAAIAAHHAARVLVNPVLAPVSASSPNRRLGAVWLEGKDLGSDAHIEGLLRDPVGGSVRGQLRTDPNHFRSIPLEILPDSLSSYADELLIDRAHVAYEQIRLNADEHAATLERIMADHAVDVVREAMSIEGSLEYWDGVDGKLAEIEQALQTKLADLGEPIPDFEEARQEMERKVRHLPYPWALATRAAGALAIGAAVGQAVKFLASGRDWWVPVVAIVAMLVGVGPFVVRYWLMRRRIRALIEIYLRRVERRIERNIEVRVYEAMLVELERLRAFIGTGEDSIKAKLQALKEQLGLLRDWFMNRAEHRGEPPLETSRLSMLVPGDDYPTADLAQQFPLPPDLDLVRVVVEAIVVGSLELSLPDAERRVVDALDPYLPKVWPELPLLPEELPRTFKQAKDLLATPTAPILRRSELSAAEYDLRRQACIPTRLVERISAALTSSGSVEHDGGDDSEARSVDIDAVLECTDGGFIGMVSLSSLADPLAALVGEPTQ